MLAHVKSGLRRRRRLLQAVKYVGETSRDLNLQPDDGGMVTAEERKPRPGQDDDWEASLASRPAQRMKPFVPAK